MNTAEKKLNPYIAVAIVALFVAAAFLGRWQHEKNVLTKINSFETCRDAGFPIMESYPPQCRTADGRTFIQQIPQNQDME